MSTYGFERHYPYLRSPEHPFKGADPAAEFVLGNGGRLCPEGPPTQELAPQHDETVSRELLILHGGRSSRAEGRRLRERCVKVRDSAALSNIGNRMQVEEHCSVNMLALTFGQSSDLEAAFQAELN